MELNKEKIISNFSYVTENTTNVDALLNRVLEKRILTTVEYSDIKSETKPYKRNTELYTIVLRKGEDNIRKFFQCLRDCGNDTIYNILTRGVHTIECIWFEIGAPTKYFVGRETTMDRMQQWQHGAHQTNELSFVAVTGLGGVGKSEVAKNFAKIFYEQVNGHAVWINADTGQSRLGSFRRLSQRLDISLRDYDGKEKSLEVITVDVYKAMAYKDNNCLLIFDNVDNYEEHFLMALVEVWNYQPPSIRRPFMILTSRFAPVKEVLGYFSEQIELDVLSDESAEKFVIRALGVTTERDLPIKRLCGRLNNYPLALQQAVAYINVKKRNSPLRLVLINYLEALDEEERTLLAFPLPRLQAMGNISQTTYLTWKVTLQKINSLEHIGLQAVNLMNTISFLSPERINTDILARLTTTTEEVVEILNDYSMFKLFTDDHNIQSIWVHRLVQEVHRIDLAENGKLIETLDELLFKVEEILQTNEALELLDHVSTIWTHTWRHPLLAKKYQSLPDCLKEHGKYEDVLSMYRQILSVKEFEFGLEDVSTLTTKLDIASTLDLQGKHEEALVVYREVLEIQTKLFGNEHPDTLNTKNGIAGTLDHQGKFDVALAIYRKVLQVSEKKLHKDHPSILTTQNNIAVTLTHKGDHDAALAMHRQILETRQRISGRDHSATVLTNYNIAAILHTVGRYDEADKIYQEVLGFQEKKYGGKNLFTLKIKRKIAQNYNCQGKFEKAVVLFSQVLEMQERVLGKEDPIAQITKRYLALALQGQGHYADAEVLYKEVLEVQEKIVGRNHPSSLVTKQHLASTLEHQGNFVEAVATYREVLDMEQRRMGHDHPNTQITKNNLAVALHHHGDYDEALLMYKQVLEIEQGKVGKNYHLVLTTEHNIAKIQHDKGNFEIAREMYEKALVAQQRVLGKENPLTLTTKHNIAKTYHDMGNYEEALSRYNQVLLVQGKILGKDNPAALKTKHSIANTLYEQGRYEGSLRLYTEVLEVQEKVLGKENPATLLTKENILKVLGKHVPCQR